MCTNLKSAKRLLSVFLIVFINSYVVSAQYIISDDSVKNSYLISKLDSMGLDNSPMLNEYETEYFNNKMNLERKNFDFATKKIAFFDGSALSSKSNYFNNDRKRFANNHSTNHTYLGIFDEKEKAESGGYDAVVVYWAKMFRPNSFYVKKLKALKGTKNK